MGNLGKERRQKMQDNTKKIKLKPFNKSDHDQKEFIQKRKGKIGGSAIAACMRLHKYYLIQDLFLDLQDPTRLDQKSSPNWRMQKGSALERLIVQKYTEQYSDATVFFCEEQIQHPIYDYFVANVDGFSLRDGQKRVLEIKYITYKNAWNLEPAEYAVMADMPAYIWCQCQHYLDCTGLDLVDLFVLFDDGFNDQSVLYQIKRDPAWICRQRIAGMKMHKMVCDNTPPQPMTEDEVKALYPVPRETTKTCDEDTLNLFEHYKNETTKFETLKKRVRDSIAKQIQDAQKLLYNDQVIATRKINKNGTAILRLK